MILDKIIATVFGLLVLFGHCQAQEGIDGLRNAFHTIEDKEDIEALLDIAVTGSVESNCSGHAYKAASTALMAEYVKWPGTKLKYFKQGIRELDALLAEHQCLESTYLRLLIQYKSPRFLGYHDSIQMDSLYFWSNIVTAEIPELTKSMLVSSLHSVSTK